MMGKALRLVIAGVAIISLSEKAMAADLDLLRRLLIPGYIAQDFASACSLRDSRYLAEGADGFTSIASYAEHLKKEITFNLSQEDAIKVQTAAANIAQNIARSEVLRRANQQTAALDKPIQGWCTTIARQFILGLISTHVKKHRKFDLLVRIATTNSRR